MPNNFAAKCNGTDTKPPAEIHKSGFSFLKKEIEDHPQYLDLIEHLLVYPGKVAEEIVEKADRFGCEAIVLGAPNCNFVKKFFPGSTAKNVLKLTKKPVFLVSVKKGTLNITTYNNGSSQKEMP